MLDDCENFTKHWKKKPKDFSNCEFEIDVKLENGYDVCLSSLMNSELNQDDLDPLYQHSPVEIKVESSLDDELFLNLNHTDEKDPLGTSSKNDEENDLSKVSKIHAEKSEVNNHANELNVSAKEHRSVFRKYRNTKIYNDQTKLDHLNCEENIKCNNDKIKDVSKYLPNLPMKKKSKRTSNIGIQSKVNLEKSKSSKPKWKPQKRKKVICEVCGKEKLVTNIKIHMKTHETFDEKYSFTCDICGKNFVSAYSLNIHIKAFHVQDLQFECPLENCRKKFVNKKSLNSHVKRHSSNCREKPFKCRTCNKQFFYGNYLQKHIKTYHENEPSFKCEECPKRFFEKSTLEKHKIVHSEEKPFSCSECLATFSYEQSLSRHKKSKHSSEKNFACKICGKQFALYEGIRQHMQKHNIKYSMAYEKGLTDGKHFNENNFTCGICGKKFLGIKYNVIYSHMRIHGIKYSREHINNIQSESNKTNFENSKEVRKENRLSNKVDDIAGNKNSNGLQ